jgi:hypothetical protein
LGGGRIGSYGSEGGRSLQQENGHAAGERQ